MLVNCEALALLRVTLVHLPAGVCAESVCAQQLADLEAKMSGAGYDVVVDVDEEVS